MKLTINFLAVENQPSNSSMISYYEAQAKNHINEYFKVLENRRTKSESLPDLIPPRNAEKIPMRGDIPEITALAFFDQLLESFKEFKDYCVKNPNLEDCITMQNDRLEISNFLGNK